MSHQTFEFPAPWTDLRGGGPDEASWRDRVNRELRAEVPRGHALFRVSTDVLARCNGCDDIVVALPGGRFAIVHLTFARRPERLPYPSTIITESWAAAEQAILAEHPPDE